MWEAIKDFVFSIIDFFYGFVGDWGMAILIITILFRAIITPLMFKQTKSTFQMNKIQPKLQSIQERFADDKLRQQEEMQKLYAEAKFNPLAGCVPMLIQMPIFVALFQVLREMGSRVSDSTTYTFYNLVPDLVKTPGDTFAMGFGPFIPYLLLLVIFAGATFIPTLIMQKDNKNASQKRQTMIMMAVMSVMMIFIGWSSPAGVLLFWGASSILAIIQQQGSMAILRKRDKEAEAAAAEKAALEPVKVDVHRKAKKKRPNKKR